MTYEDVNIKFTDELLSIYQFNGSFSHDDLRYERRIKLTDREKKLYTDNGFEWFPTLTGFMIHNGYFFDDEQRGYYIMTERGNRAKELKGHKNFQKYKKREDKQGSINILLAIAALLGILSPFLLEIGKQNKWWFNYPKETTSGLKRGMTMVEVENLLGRPMNTNTKDGKINDKYEDPTVITWYYDKYPIRTSDKSYGSPGYINFVPVRFFTADNDLTDTDSTAWFYGEQSNSFRVVSYVGSFPVDTLSNKWNEGGLDIIPLKKLNNK